MHSFIEKKKNMIMKEYISMDKDMEKGTKEYNADNNKY